MRVQTAAIDFDGVIHEYSKGWHNGLIYDPPIPGAFDAIKAIQKTMAVAITTSRSVIQVGYWMTEHGFSCCVDTRCEVLFWNDQVNILVTNRKISAAVYIDDRAIRFGNWEQTLFDMGAK